MTLRRQKRPDVYTSGRFDLLGSGVAAETAAAITSDADGDADGVAPLADPAVGDAVDGLVGPFRRGARERLRVGVAGGGVDREQDEAFAVGAVDLEFALIEEGAAAFPAPVYIDLVAADREVDHGTEGGEVGAADLLGAFDAERLADGGVVIAARFDLLDERAEADFDAGRDDGNSSKFSRSFSVAGDGTRCTESLIAES